MSNRVRRNPNDSSGWLISIIIVLLIAISIVWVGSDRWRGTNANDEISPKATTRTMDG